MELSRRRDYVLLGAFNLAYLLGFGWRFLRTGNLEFLLYVGVVLLSLGIIAASLTRVGYARRTLIGLTVWGLLHMAGGGVAVGDGRLYDVLLVRLVRDLPVLRYDQVVHAWGFGVCTLMAYDLLRGRLAEPARIGGGLGLVLVMAGLGFGALNEIVEFGVTRAVPGAGVGGYTNTALDLCANLVGALFALGLLRYGVRHGVPR